MLKDIINLIDQEIKWSQDKDNQIMSGVTEEETIWFVRGLEQARLIINKYNNNKNEECIKINKKAKIIACLKPEDGDISEYIGDIYDVIEEHDDEIYVELDGCECCFYKGEYEIVESEDD